MHRDHVGLAVVLVVKREAHLVLGLLREAAHHANARQGLLQVGGDRPDRLSCAAEGAGGGQAEPQAATGQQRKDEERQQRQLGVEHDQDDDCSQQRQTRLEESHDGVGDEAVQCLHVVGHARYQHACRAALIKAHGQRLQVREDADAQVGQRPLADPAHEVGLRVGHAPHQQRRDQKRHHDQCQCGGVVLLDAAVDRGSRQQRWCQRRGCAEQQRGEGHHHARPIGAQQRDQATQVATARAWAGALAIPLRASAQRAAARTTTSDYGAHMPLTSRSRVSRVMNTCSGRPFSTISRYSSETSSSS